MAVRLPALPIGRGLLPRNIIFLLLVSIWVRGWVNPGLTPVIQTIISSSCSLFISEKNPGILNYPPPFFRVEYKGVHHCWGNSELQLGGRGGCNSTACSLGSDVTQSPARANTFWTVRGSLRTLTSTPEQPPSITAPRTWRPWTN
jgi:hypothetical protein